MTKKLKYLKKELDLMEADGIVCGYVDGYLISFSNTDKKVELFIDAEIDDKNTAMVETLRDFIKSNANAYSLKNSSLSNTGISISVLEKDSEALIEFFYLLIHKLKAQQVADSDFCSNCGGALGGEHTILKIGNHAHTTDRACAEKILTSRKAKIANKPHSRVILGLLGGLLVGLVGTLPYLYLGYRGLICSYAVFLIPLAVSFGYFTFGGKAGLGKLIVCFLLPLILYAAAVAGSLCYSVYLSWFDAGYVIEFKELLMTVWENLRTNSDLRGAFLYRQGLFGLVYLIIGYLFVLPTAYKKPERYFAIVQPRK